MGERRCAFWFSVREGVVAERKQSNRSSLAGLEHTKKEISSGCLLFVSLKARDGIRTRDPRLGKAILHH